MAQTGALEEELATFGAGPPETLREKRREALKLLECFVQHVITSMNGREVDHALLETGEKVAMSPLLPPLNNTNSSLLAA